MLRIRSIPRAVAEIKRADPGAYINETIVRRWVKMGLLSRVPHPGRMALINLDELLEFLGSGIKEEGEGE